MQRRPPGRARRRLGTLAVAGCVVAMAAAPAARASSMQLCDRPVDTSAAQRDTLLRFAALVKDALDTSGAGLAIISRSGTDLSRFGQRYSHAGISLRESAQTPWSVRQLYYACDEHRPRLYDEGMAGFLSSAGNAPRERVSLVFVPQPWAATLGRAALDDTRALAVLSPVYSANAYPYSTRYENCNQWVVEMLALAWGGIEDTGPSARASAQAWLAMQDYGPSVFKVPWHPLEWVVGQFSLLHNDDHPPGDLAADQYLVSMPASVNAFVQGHVAGAHRLEMCRDGRRVVVHAGWDELGDACTPAGGDDRVIDLAP